MNTSFLSSADTTPRQGPINPTTIPPELDLNTALEKLDLNSTSPSSSNNTTPKQEPVKPATTPPKLDLNFDNDAFSKLVGPLDLEEVLRDPTNVLKGMDQFVAKAKPDPVQLEDRYHAETQKLLSPQKFSFFKNAKESYDKGFLKSDYKNFSNNQMALASAAEGDDVFSNQTIKKMAMHQELKRAVPDKARERALKEKVIIKFKKLLKPKP